MKKLSESKKAELRVIVGLTLDATLAVEEKTSRLAARAKPSLPTRAK